MSQDPSASDFTPPDIEEISSLLPSYEVLSFIAKGGMGAVYLARQKSLERDVAIKVLPRHFGADAEFRESFATEAKSMAKFNHPNLIGIYDFGKVDGMLYIIMEMVSGESLYHAAYGKTIEPKECARIVKGICEGLASAHKYGILHRDIKPANILLDAQGSPKIGDFGLARPVGDYENDSAFGTPGYTAPEVIHRPAAVDESTDLYSVGVMLYELLTGKLPEDIYTSASSLTGCDPDYDEIIRKAIHPTPAMRYRKAEDFAKALDKVAEKKENNNPLMTGATSNRSSKLITPGSTRQSPQLKTGSNSVKSSVSGTTKSTLSPSVSTGSSTSFIRNIIIIIALLAAIYIAWEGVKGARASREADQAEQDAKREAAAQQQKEDLEAKRKKARAQAKANSQKTSPSPPPIIQESPREALTRLTKQLFNGKRTEFPKNTIIRDGRARMYIDQAMTWHNAQAFCERRGGHLAILPETSDLQWLCNQLKGDQTVWLGAGTSGKNQWCWIDGTEWKQDIRKTSKAAYAAVDDTSILAPQPASNKNGFFIEWLMDGSTPASIKNQLKRCAESLDSDQPIYPAGTISYDNRHYLLVQMDINWRAARSLAARAQGTLAVPSNPDEDIWMLEFIANYLSEEQACWIGGFRLANQTWQWSTGETWSFAKWGEGEPDYGGKKMAVCAIQPDQSWNDFGIKRQLSHFLIEWSKDNEGKASAKINTADDPTTAATPVDTLTPTRRKCAILIKNIQTKYDKDFKNNISSYEVELSSFLRGHPKSLVDTYTPIIEAMTKSYPNNRIPTNTPRTNMPMKVSKILDSHLDKQDRLQIKYLTEIEALRGQYRSALQKNLQELESKGLKSQSRPIANELKSTSGGAERFVAHVLGAK